jgi:hypothetical protein
VRIARNTRGLAEKCRDDAAKAGINKWALEIVAGGDLIHKLIGALNEAEFRQTAAISGAGVQKRIGRRDRGDLTPTQKKAPQGAGPR